MVDGSEIELTPTFSIITPLHNTSLGVLTETVESVLAQTYAGWELLLVDDCSTSPKTRYALNVLARRDDRIVVHRRAAAGGMAAASNDAIRLARGEFLVLLGAEDLLAPGALAVMAAAIVENPDADHLYSDDDPFQRVGERARRIVRVPEILPELREPRSVGDRRIVVHAGLPKTGTSALQRWLSDNQAVLREHGVHYPHHGVDRNGVSSGNLERLMVADDDGWRVSRPRVATTLAEFEATESSVLLLSSEFFASKLDELAALLPQGTTFVLYVRNPLEYLESHYNQAVKRGRRTTAFTADLPARGLGIGHLDAVLGRVPPDVEVVVRPYHDDLFVGGDLLRDFLGTAGIALPDGLTQGFRRVNPSYSLEALEFMRVLNHLPMPGAVVTPIDRALQRTRVGDFNYSLIPPAAFEKLRGYALDEIDRVIAIAPSGQLSGLREVIEKQAPGPYREQTVPLDALRAIALDLHARRPALIGKILSAAESGKGGELPYPGFVEMLTEINAEPDAAAVSLPLGCAP